MARALDNTLEDVKELDIQNEIKAKHRGPGKIYDIKQTFPDLKQSVSAIKTIYGAASKT
jgi:hypothetical protein